MLTFAFDSLTRTDDGTRVTARPNCQVEGPAGRRYACGLLLPICLLDRPQLDCAPTETLIRDGRPFVYPLELRFNLQASLAQNPDLAPAIPKPVLDRVRAGRAAVLEARDRYFACLPALEHNRAHLLEGRQPLDGVWHELEAVLG